jgi:hypothetical protein
MSFPKNKINLEVLLYALSQQVDPLPPDLQRSLTEIGRSIQAHPTDENKIELRELIRDYQPLEIVYRDALTRSNQSYVAQERTKSLDATFPTMSGLDDLSIESFLLPANDWVAAAKQLKNQLNPLQNPAKFWDKTDKIAVMTAGGIAIGSAIAQLPGALVGGAVGAGYGWYVGFRQATTRKSTREKITSKNVDRWRSLSIGESIVDNNEIDREIDFYDIPTEQLVMLAQSATTDAVKDLHQKGISTYGMRNGIIYETNPITETQSVVEKDRQS